MARAGRFSPEVRERAVRMGVEHAAAHPSQWAAITSIAAKLGCSAETLRSWVRQAERDAGQRPGDRKSTRLNSSHPSISYAVFCLKKKNRMILQSFCF